MSASVEINLTPEAQAVLARVASFPADARVAIARTMDQQNLLTVSHIQRRYLSFARQGPTTLEGLRTFGGYRNRLRTSKAHIDGTTITSGIGSNITNRGFSYPALHEFGGSWTKKAGKVRLRETAGGELERQAGGRLAKFAARHHKRFREVAFAGGTQVTMPARAPITRGIQDREQDYGAAVSETIVTTWNGGKS